MRKNIKNRRKSHKFSSPSCDFYLTKQSLSYTPADMHRLSEKGIPISQMAVDESMFYDGDTGNSMSYDPLLERGVDPTIAWELQQTARKNMLNGLKKDIEHYG